MISRTVEKVKSSRIKSLFLKKKKYSVSDENLETWTPPVNDNLTLREVYDSLPGYNPNEISQVVRFFENPKSRYSLSGAISLERHDCVHILLGRGLMNTDEAFVLGFTMGNDKNFKEWEKRLFHFVSRWLYPYPYTFNKEHINIFDFGLEYGRSRRARNIHLFSFEDNMDKTIKELRHMLDINFEELIEIYKTESNLIINKL